MAAPVLPEASAAIHAAVYAARRGALGKEKESRGTRGEKQPRNGNFVCSPLSILLVFALAMRGTRGRTTKEMERLLPFQAVPALLPLTVHSSSGRLPDKEEQTGGTNVRGEEGARGIKVELDLVSRMYVDGRLASNTSFRSFRDELLRDCSSGDARLREPPIQLIDCNKADESAKEINAFFSETTRGRITALVSAEQITPATRLLLVSAAFFKGPWKTPFRKHETKKAPFYALDLEDRPVEGQTARREDYRDESEKERRLPSNALEGTPEPRLIAQSVDSMSILLKAPSPFYFKISDTVTAVGLPYRDTNYVMYVVQPHNPIHLEKLLRPESEKSHGDSFPTLNDVVRSMRESRQESGDVEARLSLPKFALRATDNHLDLVPLFTRLLEIEAPFDRTLADFSGISGDQTLFISAFVHQAEIDVDEKGTVASAATLAAITLKKAWRPKRSVDIVINKPFAFQIRYHPPEGSVAQAGGAPSEGVTIRESKLLGDYVLFTGCITDALAAQR